MDFIRRGSFGSPVPELAFVVVALGTLVAGRTEFFNDPGTFWHARLGEEIEATSAAPRIDTLSQGKAGGAWVDQSWLFDLGLSQVVRSANWAGAGLATALILGAIYAGLAAWLLALGVSPLAAGVASFVAAGLGSIHFLCRPHLFTFAGTLVVLAACRSAHQGRLRSLLVIPAVVGVWANLHGGFLAGVFIVVTAAVAELAAGRASRDRSVRIALFLATAIAASLAALVNPYGLGLYRHVFDLLLHSGVTRHVQEYQPIDWFSGEAVLLESVLLAALALGCLRRRFTRDQFFDLAHAAVWLVLGVGSVRNLPLFGIAFAPVLGRLLSDQGGSAPCVDRGRIAWPAGSAAVGLVLVGLVATRTLAIGPSGDHWPAAGLAAVGRLGPTTRLFNEQDWGGLISWQNREAGPLPWIDDRFELWTESETLDYRRALDGGAEWDALDQRVRFDAVFVRPACGLAHRLARDPGWSVTHRDAISVLVERRPTLAQAVGMR